MMKFTYEWVPFLLEQKGILYFPIVHYPSAIYVLLVNFERVTGVRIRFRETLELVSIRKILRDSSGFVSGAATLSH
jgi:hypothetical protein